MLRQSPLNMPVAVALTTRSELEHTTLLVLVFTLTCKSLVFH
jgi:hypothetical protein